MCGGARLAPSSSCLRPTWPGDRPPSFPPLPGSLLPPGLGRGATKHPSHPGASVLPPVAHCPPPSRSAALTRVTLGEKREATARPDLPGSDKVTQGGQTGNRHSTRCIDIATQATRATSTRLTVRSGGNAKLNVSKDRGYDRISDSGRGWAGVYRKNVFIAIKIGAKLRFG